MIRRISHNCSLRQQFHTCRSIGEKYCFILRRRHCSYFGWFSMLCCDPRKSSSSSSSLLPSSLSSSSLFLPAPSPPPSPPLLLLLLFLFLFFFVVVVFLFFFFFVVCLSDPRFQGFPIIIKRLNHNGCYVYYYI